MKKILPTLLTCAALSLGQASYAAVPSTVNYQGYLTDTSGSPVNNNAVSVTFLLYDVSVGGVAVWSETQVVDVSKGLFNVKLGGVTPFSVGLFDVPMWLGIQVDTDAEMSPRSTLNSVGYALKAEDADTLNGQIATDLDQSSHVSDTSNPHNVVIGQIADAVSTSDLSSHSANTNAHHAKYTDAEATNAMGAKANNNALNHDKTTSLPWSSIFSKPAGFADNIDNAGVTNVIAGTSLSGGGTSSTVTLNLTAPIDLSGTGSSIIKGAGSNGPTIGYLGVQGSNDFEGIARLDIVGLEIGTLGISHGSSQIDNYGMYGFSNRTGVYGRGEARDESAAATVYGGQFYGYGNSLGGTTYGVRALASAEGTATAYGVYSSATNGPTTGKEYAFYGVGDGYFSGNVGVGVGSSNTYKLYVDGPVANSYVTYINNDNNSSGSASGLFARGDARGTGTGGGFGATFYGYGGSTSGVAYGTRHYAIANGTSNAYGIYSSATGGTTTGKEYAFYGNGMGYFSGDLGLGTTSPEAKLHVYSSGSSSDDATLSDGSGVLLIGRESSSNIIMDNNEIMARNNGAPSKLYLNKDSTHVVVPGLEITGGADIAEPFNVSDQYKVLPGMVMAIDSENPGKLRVADNSYDHTVAGIVSGANGINPGVSLTQTGVEETQGSTLVALTGRLYALADAKYGEIKPGDLLTTSDTLGHIMKVSDYSKARGAIIGKAMTALKAGQGHVLVLVSLQ